MKFSLLILFFLVLEAASVLACPNTSSYLRATHYWGNAWPITFWDTLELHQVPKDFEKIKKDGFDAIIVPIPWGHFHQDVKVEKYNRKALARLRQVFKNAQAKKLKVILRLSYFWDFDPAVKSPQAERFNALFYDQKMRRQWGKYLAQIFRVSKDFDNFLFGFITWEDNWSIIELTSAPIEERKLWASRLGYASAKNKTDPAVPLKTDPDLKLFYALVDKILIGQIYREAKKNFPKLSMEVRTDFDPIQKEDGRRDWYPHDATYRLPDTECSLFYHGISHGALNESDIISVDRALILMERHLKRVQTDSKGKSLFIDQFLYSDNTPAFSHNSRLSEGDLGKFLKASIKNLATYTSGYALWSQKDYAASVIFNGSFELGLQGWSAGKNESVVEKDGDYWLRISGNGMVSQDISKNRTDASMFATYKNAKLCLKARGESELSRLDIFIDSKKVFQKTFTRDKEDYFCHDLPAQEAFKIKFQTSEGAVLIDDVTLYAHIFKTHIYDLDGKENILLASIQDLNKSLAAIPAPPSQYLEKEATSLMGVSSDGWASNSVTGKIQIPADVEKKVLVLKTWLPADWTTQPMVTVSVAGEAFTISLKKEHGEYLIPIKGLTRRKGQSLNFELATPDVFGPPRSESGQDQRKLGYILKGFGFSDKRNAK
jgi:hypothetical protein